MFADINKNVHNEGNKHLLNYNFACNTEKN